MCSCDVWLVRVSDASKHRCKSRDFLDSICRVLLFPVCYNLRNWQRHSSTAMDKDAQLSTVDRKCHQQGGNQLPYCHLFLHRWPGSKLAILRSLTYVYWRLQGVSIGPNGTFVHAAIMRSRALYTHKKLPTCESFVFLWCKGRRGNVALLCKYKGVDLCFQLVAKSANGTLLHATGMQSWAIYTQKKITCLQIFHLLMA